MLAACLAPVRIERPVISLRDESLCSYDSHPNMSRVGILGPCSEPLAGWLAGLPLCRLSAVVGVACRTGNNDQMAMHGTADGRITGVLPQPIHRPHSSGPRRRCRRRIKCRVQDHRCRARWMEPPWASTTASSLHQLACQRRPPSGSGAQGRETPPPSCHPAHPDSNAKLQAHGPRSSRQLGGAQAQISVVKRWWGPQIPGPIHFTDVQQLDYPLYRHVPPEQLHPSKPTRGTLSTYLPEPAKGKEKRGPVLDGVSGKGGRRDNRHLPKKTVQIPRRFLARRRLLEPTSTLTASRYLPSSSTPVSPTPASHRNHRLRAVSTSSPPSSSRSTQCLYPAFTMADTYVLPP